MTDKDPNDRRDRKDPNPDAESDRDVDPRTDRENVERPYQKDRDTDEPVPGDTDDEM